MACDLKVVLLDVLERYHDALVQSYLGKDLPGSRADGRYWPCTRRLGRVASGRVLGARLVVTRLLDACLRLADATA